MSESEELDTLKTPVGFVTLGMFIIDDFSFSDKEGKPTGKIGGGGTYAAIGARIWLPENEVGMIVDKGHDFPDSIEATLLKYGADTWLFRNKPDRLTTRALNSYQGEHRGFEYATPRLQITPQDIVATRIAEPRILHFICSPTRASSIMSEIGAVENWRPVTIYEPIPVGQLRSGKPSGSDCCVAYGYDFEAWNSPNAEEALSLLSMPLPPTRTTIEDAANRFLQHGIGKSGQGWVVIRSGSLGAYVKAVSQEGQWVEAFWTNSEEDEARVVDVTGAGNSFLGGLAAGLILTGDVIKAMFYASVSASFTIEQAGLPTLSRDAGSRSLWNGDVPLRRLETLLTRHEANRKR